MDPSPLLVHVLKSFKISPIVEGWSATLDFRVKCPLYTDSKVPNPDSNLTKSYKQQSDGHFPSKRLK